MAGSLTIANGQLVANLIEPRTPPARSSLGERGEEDVERGGASDPNSVLARMQETGGFSHAPVDVKGPLATDAGDPEPDLRGRHAMPGSPATSRLNAMDQSVTDHDIPDDPRPWAEDKRPRPAGACWKVLVPRVATGLADRARLAQRLPRAFERRLTVLAAGAGLGKTTLVASWAEAEDAAWYTLDEADRDPLVLAAGVLEAVRLRAPRVDPRVLTPAGEASASGMGAPDDAAASLADVVGAELARALGRDLVLVLDDVHQIGPRGPAAQFVAGLVRGSPAALHIAVLSREDPPFGIARLRAQGQVLDITGGSLRFTEPECAAVVAAALGHEGASVASAIHDATGGWPGGVRLLVDWLRDAAPEQWPAMVGRAGEPDTPVAAFLAEEVLPDAGDDVLEVLRRVGSLDRFTLELVTELGAPGANALVPVLARHGLWFAAAPGPDGWYRIPPAVATFLRARIGEGQPRRATSLRRAATWMKEHGEPQEALALLVATGDEEALADAIHEWGGTALIGGHDNVWRLASPPGPGSRSPGLAYVEAGTRLVRGDFEGVLQLVGPHIPPEGAVAMEAGLLAGLVHHLRGELEEAIALYERALARMEPGTDALRATLLGWHAAARWLLGDVSRCRQLADEAATIAAACGDDRAASVAHTALAMVAALDGDRRANDLHYLRALKHAEAAQDHVQVVRIRTNRGSRFLEEGYYAEALAELDEAIRVADVAGVALFRGLAMSNRGQALRALGRLDEAAREFEAARVEYERLGSRMGAYPLAHAAEVHRQQGHLTLARAACEEAIAMGRASGDRQSLVPALATLALVAIDVDLEEAATLAAEAVDLDSSLHHSNALLAAGEVALRCGDRPGASKRAEQAIEVARTQRDRPALAEALELQARVTEDRGTAHRLLGEAASLWKAIGSPLGEARVALARARLLPQTEAGPLCASAEAEFRALGARALAAEAARFRAELAEATQPAIAIHVLGGFRIDRAGVPIPPAEWQSRKARDLLKLLVARRGRPVPRDVLLDVLWPDEGLARSSQRLSVALSTVRAVLDPHKRFEADWFVAADRDSARVRLDNIVVDVETFLAESAAGRRAMAAGDTVTAAARLAAADAVYTGEFFEEDPYEEWTVALREEARSTYASVATTLADLALADGDHDRAVRYLLRLLACDPYDERAHLRLVAAFAAAGRHGDARRGYRSYCDRMAEIDIEPAPYPTALSRAAGT